MQATKEKAADVAASAKSGMEKTKAVVGEKVEKMGAHSEMEKEMAEQKKDDRIHEAESNKQELYENNAAARQASYSTGAPHSSYSTTGEPGQPTGTHQMSALPGHGTGAPEGQVVEGVGGSHPSGTATGTQRPIGTATNQGYGTGGAHSS